MEPSSVFRLSARTLTTAARRDAGVSWVIAQELNRRLYEVLEQTAVNAFGSVRQRVAAHGFRVLPARVEFWQGSADGLHDRIRYRQGGGGWILERLSP